MRSLAYMTEEQLDAVLTHSQQLEELQAKYEHFPNFYFDVSEDLLGFTPSEMQMDIAQSLQNSGDYYMIQSQRKEAKTTIAGCYAVWRLIHNPKFRVLIVTADSNFASDVMRWCTQILDMMPELSVLAMDPTKGCRRNSNQYDVNLLLKGADKSPSIGCVGIFGTLPGKRADLILADDIETDKNSYTAVMRQRLLDATTEFKRVNPHGKILYLGTPQNTNSIYDSLPSRGCVIDIWTGRIPTEEERDNYGVHLSPYVTHLYDNYPELRTGFGVKGDKGAPTDPVMLSEEDLVSVEQDSPAGFNLHYMLDTSLVDKDKFPLKPENLIVYSLNKDKVPAEFLWSKDPKLAIPAVSGQIAKHTYYWPAYVSDTFIPYEQKIMAVDPAGGGQNGDETGVSILYTAAGYIFLMHVTGIPGGSEDTKLDMLLELGIEWGVTRIINEKNFGHGMFTLALQKRQMQYNKAAKKAGLPTADAGIEEVYSSGQKESRIIDVMEPVVSAHTLIVNLPCIEDNIASVQKYDVSTRVCFNWFHQLANITLDRGSLTKYDRLDSTAIGVSDLAESIRQVASDAIDKSVLEEHNRRMQDPSNIWSHAYGGINNMLARPMPGTLDRLRRR